MADVVPPVPPHPKEETHDSLIVSFPLSKLDDRFQLKSFSIPKLKPSSAVVTTLSPSTSLVSPISLQQRNSIPHMPPPPGPVPFQSAAGQVPFPNPVPNMKQNSSNVVVVSVSNQVQPVPLFPQKYLW